MTELDETDEDIIRVLYRDGSLAAPEVARQISEPEAEVADRLRALEGSVLDRYVAVDPRKLGYEEAAYIFVQCEETYDEAIQGTVEHADEWDGVQSIMTVFGEYDIVIKKLSKSDDDLDRFVTNAINLYEECETYPVTHEVRSNGFAIPEDEQRGTATVVDELDDLDRAVLAELRDDCTLRHNQETLADAVSSNPADVDKAIEKLEERGVVRGYSVSLDYGELGWLKTVLGISTLRSEYDTVVENLVADDRAASKDPFHVPTIYSGLGFRWADLFLELVVESTEQLDSLTDTIRSVDGVKTTRTYVGANQLYSDPSVSP